MGSRGRPSAAAGGQRWPSPTRCVPGTPSCKPRAGVPATAGLLPAELAGHSAQKCLRRRRAGREIPQVGLGRGGGVAEGWPRRRLLRRFRVACHREALDGIRLRFRPAVSRYNLEDVVDMVLIGIVGLKLLGMGDRGSSCSRGAKKGSAASVGLRTDVLTLRRNYRDAWLGMVRVALLLGLAIIRPSFGLLRIERRIRGLPWRGRTVCVVARGRSGAATLRRRSGPRQGPRHRARGRTRTSVERSSADTSPELE